MGSQFLHGVDHDLYLGEDNAFYMGLWAMIVTCAYIAIVTWAQIMDFSPTICMSGTIASAGTDKRPRQKVQAKEVSWINGLFAHHMYEWCGTIASAGTDKRPR